MILTTHALTGAAIGKSFSNPWIIVTLSIGVHFLLDTLRHGEYIDHYSKIKESYRKIAIDCLTGLLIISFIVYTQRYNKDHFYNLYLGAFSSMFPDLLTFLNFLSGGKVKILKKVYKFHEWLHNFHPLPFQRQWNFRNAVNDILISLIAIIILLSL